MGEEQREKQEDNAQHPELYIVKGTRLNIPKFTISFDDNGQLKGELTLHTGLDMCPYWLKIAYAHLLHSEMARDSLVEAKKREDDKDIGNALETEFTSGMQAVMAAGIAIDAFYASVRERVEISDDTIQSWKKNRTARYIQIAETFRIAFKLHAEDATLLRDVLRQNFGVRDKAVHPSSKTSEFMLHPEMEKATDWRFATFCFTYSKIIVKLTMQVIDQLTKRIDSKNFINPALAEYCHNLAYKIEPLISEWEAKYGSIQE